MPLSKDESVRLVTRAATDFAFFCREILGYKDMIRREDEVLPGYSHDDLCRFLQSDPTPFKLILLPRYSFKSTIATIGKSLWDLVRNDSLRVLICSDTNEKAEGFLEGIKNHLEGKIAGSRFRELFGAWEVDPKKGAWNQAEIVIRPRQIAQVEPSVDTAGIESSKTGKHYDVIDFDDLVSEKNVTTPELLEKVKGVYKKALSLLKPGGELRMVGTRWHYADLYGSIMAQEQQRALTGEPTVFATYLRQAEVDGVYPWAAIGLTQSFLAQQRSEQGSYVYSCLYQQEPVDDETAMFKAADFVFYPPTEPPRELFISCCLDPIPPVESTAGDDAALTVVGTDAEMNLYLLDAIAGRLQPSEQVDALFALHAKWHIRVLGIEDNHWQKTLVRDIELRVAKERQTNPHFRLFLVERLTRGAARSKHLDIRGLQPYHERHAIRLPGTRLELLTGPVQKLALQMLQYPNAAHDDLLDSLSMHVGIHRAGVVTTPQTTLPFSSAAWFERAVWAKQQAAERARLPRWSRPAPVQLAFS